MRPSASRGRMHDGHRACNMRSASHSLLAMLVDTDACLGDGVRCGPKQLGGDGTLLGGPCVLA